MSFSVKYLAFFSIILILFQSCTISKRLYREGYNVEWHVFNSYHFSSISYMNSTNFIEKPVSPVNLITTDNNFCDRAIKAIGKSIINKPRRSHTCGIHKKDIVSFNKNNYVADTLKVSNKSAYQALKFGILANTVPPLLFILSYVLGRSLTGPIYLFPFAAFFFIVTTALIFSIFAIIKGLKAMKQINDSPITYSGKGVATAGIILGLVAIAFIFVAYLIIHAI